MKPDNKNIAKRGTRDNQEVDSKIANYNAKMNDLLKEYIGDNDPFFIDFKDIDINTKKSELDFKKVRGSIRLCNPNYVLLPKDTEPIIERFISMK